jgi:hypothetical protein
VGPEVHTRYNAKKGVVFVPRLPAHGLEINFQTYRICSIGSASIMQPSGRPLTTAAPHECLGLDPNQGSAQDASLTPANGAANSHVASLAVSCPCHCRRHHCHCGSKAGALGPWQPSPWQSAAG